jgi:hypothetical protein
VQAHGGLDDLVEQAEAELLPVFFLAEDLEEGG